MTIYKIPVTISSTCNFDGPEFSRFSFDLLARSRGEIASRGEDDVDPRFDVPLF